MAGHPGGAGRLGGDPPGQGPGRPAGARHRRRHRVARRAGGRLPGAAHAARGPVGGRLDWSSPSCSLVVLVVGLVVWAVAADAVRRRRSSGSAGSWRPSPTCWPSAVVAALLWSLLSPRRPRRLSPQDHRDERERARLVVQEHGSGTLDYFALRDDKDWFFTGSSVVAALGARGSVPGVAGPHRTAGGARARLGGVPRLRRRLRLVGHRHRRGRGLAPGLRVERAAHGVPGRRGHRRLPDVQPGGPVPQVAAAGGQPHRARGLLDDLPRPVDDRPRAARADRGR